MSERLYFTPVIGYKLTRLGLSIGTDDFNNAWSGMRIACANRDPNIPYTRQEWSMMNLGEMLQVTAPFDPVRNPRAILDAPRTSLEFLTTGVFDLGNLGSPLENICRARRDNEQQR